MRRSPRGSTSCHAPRSRPTLLDFQIGAKVRVRSGVRDPDFPDIPLGGWAGTVKEVERAEGEVTCLIAWDRATLLVLSA